jgi:hypothetical protein
VRRSGTQVVLAHRARRTMHVVELVMHEVHQGPEGRRP